MKKIIKKLKFMTSLLAVTLTLIPISDIYSEVSNTPGIQTCGYDDGEFPDFDNQNDL